MEIKGQDQTRVGRLTRESISVMMREAESLNENGESDGNHSSATGQPRIELVPLRSDEQLCAQVRIPRDISHGTLKHLELVSCVQDLENACHHNLKNAPNPETAHGGVRFDVPCFRAGNIYF